MAEFEMKQPEEEKKPFYKTPIGIILIVIVVLILCCCLIAIILFASGAPIIEEIMNSPEVQQALEEAQQTIEAAE